MSKNKLPPAKCIITMGVKLTQTKYTGTISTVDMLNGLGLMISDLQKMSGMQTKEIFAILDEITGGGVFRKKPTMNASLSEKTASATSV